MLDIYPWYECGEHKGWKLFVQSGMVCVFGEGIKGEEKITVFNDDEELTVQSLKQKINEVEKQKL